MKKKLIVLSTFDGIGGCLLSLIRAGYHIDTYYCCEINKHAMAILKRNFPNIKIIFLGDILNWRDWDIDFSKIDLITGGFPCQPFSIMGKMKGFEDERGQLFFSLVDVLHEIQKVNPNVLFLFENVRMKKDIVHFINNLLGVKGILINSSLVSVQNRLRYYWTNIPNVVLPKDMGYKLSDVIPGAKGAGTRNRPSKNKNGKKYDAVTTIRKDEKSNCLVTGTTTMKVCINGNEIRFITPKEAELIQGFPVDYTLLDGLSKTKRLQLLGNSWSIPTIVYIFSFIKNINYDTQTVGTEF